MAWGADEGLCVVNTQFSCLCTLEPTESFAPRWRPPFVTALEPTDRCHLNGQAMEAGRPRYVTALGTTHSRAVWDPKLLENSFVLPEVAMSEVPGALRAGS